MAEQRWEITDEWARRLPKMWKWMRNFRVTGAGSFRNTEDTCTIAIAGQKSSPQSEPFVLPRAQYQGMGLFAVVDGQWGAAYTPAVESLT